MKVVITITVPSGTMEEDGTLENIEALLLASDAEFTWEDEA